MMNISSQQYDIERLVIHQLRQHWIEIDDNIIHAAIPAALKKIETGFKDLPNRRFYYEGKVRFSPYMSVQWMIFLYRLSHEIYSARKCTRKSAVW